MAKEQNKDIPKKMQSAINSKRSKGSPCIQEQIINSIPSFQGYASLRKPKQTT
jgi:hypothetical protein